ncbi:hypothetical protein BH09CHL1_BH09CHL1_07020 [soil metagenome]
MVDGGYGVTLKVSGNGYNGTGEMTFILTGDKIARLVIWEESTPTPPPCGHE